MVVLLLLLSNLAAEVFFVRAVVSTNDFESLSLLGLDGSVLSDLDCSFCFRKVFRPEIEVVVLVLFVVFVASVVMSFRLVCNDVSYRLHYCFVMFLDMK